MELLRLRLRLRWPVARPLLWWMWSQLEVVEVAVIES